MAVNDPSAAPAVVYVQRSIEVAEAQIFGSTYPNETAKLFASVAMSTGKAGSGSGLAYYSMLNQWHNSLGDFSPEDEGVLAFAIYRRTKEIEAARAKGKEDPSFKSDDQRKAYIVDSQKIFQDHLATLSASDPTKSSGGEPGDKVIAFEQQASKLLASLSQPYVPALTPAVAAAADAETLKNGVAIAEQVVRGRADTPTPAAPVITPAAAPASPAPAVAAGTSNPAPAAIVPPAPIPAAATPLRASTDAPAPVLAPATAAPVIAEAALAAPLKPVVLAQAPTQAIAEAALAAPLRAPILAAAAPVVASAPATPPLAASPAPSVAPAPVADAAKLDALKTIMKAVDTHGAVVAAKSSASSRAALAALMQDYIRTQNLETADPQTKSTLNLLGITDAASRDAFTFNEKSAAKPDKLELALKLYQAKAGIGADGIVGQATLNSLAATVTGHPEYSIAKLDQLVYGAGKQVGGKHLPFDHAKEAMASPAAILQALKQEVKKSHEPKLAEALAKLDPNHLDLAGMAELQKAYGLQDHSGIVGEKTEALLARLGTALGLAEKVDPATITAALAPSTTPSRAAPPRSITTAQK